jgi:hypothetical protein
MKRVAILMAVLALAAACDDDSPTKPSNTGPIVFTAQLSAANEVPPITNAESTARGTTTITFNVPRDSNGNPSGGGTVTFGIQLNSFPTTSAAVIAAHIHPGAAGANGSPLIDTRVSQATPLVLTNGAVNISITVDISQANAASIYAAPQNFYFNVHTPLNTGGAARGQLALNLQ